MPIFHSRGCDSCATTRYPGLFIGLDPTRGPGQEVPKLSRVESGRVGSGGVTGRIGSGGFSFNGSGHPDLSRPVTSEPTRGTPC